MLDLRPPLHDTFNKHDKKSVMTKYLFVFVEVHATLIIMPSAAVIQIKRSEVTEEVRALAELTGVSITDAIGIAVKHQLEIERAKADLRLAKRRKEVGKLLNEIRRLPVVGPRLTDEDLYDENGLPK